MCCMVLGSHLDREVFRDLHLENNAMQKHEIQVHKNCDPSPCNLN